MLLVRDYYTSQLIPYNEDGEIIWVEVLLHQKRKLHLSSVYRGHTAQLEFFEQSIKDCMPQNKPNSTVFIGGDFNCGDIDWENHCIKQDSRRKSMHNLLMRILDDFHLSQMVGCATRGKNLLDLFITNQPGLVKSCNVIPGYSDHEVAVTDCELNPIVQKKKPHWVQFFSKANWDDLKTRAAAFRVFPLPRKPALSRSGPLSRSLLTISYHQCRVECPLTDDMYLGWTGRHFKTLQKKTTLVQEGQKRPQRQKLGKLQSLQARLHPAATPSQVGLHQQHHQSCVRRKQHETILEVRQIM